MAKKKKRRKPKRAKRKPPKPAATALPAASWLDGDGMHMLLPGEQPTPEMLAEMTKAYQERIRKSPLWKEMVRAYGKEVAERKLAEFRVELRA